MAVWWIAPLAAGDVGQPLGGPADPVVAADDRAAGVAVDPDAVLAAGAEVAGVPGDVVAPAKILTEFTKDLEDKIKIRVAVVEGRKVDVNGVKALAKLPGLPELRAQLLGMLNQPAGKLVRTIAAPSSQLVRVSQARIDALGSAS